MRFKRRIKELLLLVILGVAVYWFGLREKPPVRGDESTVIGVIDGDTVELEDGRTVRLIGIDTPERGDLYYDSASALHAYRGDVLAIIVTSIGEGARWTVRETNTAPPTFQSLDLEALARLREGPSLIPPQGADALIEEPR